MLSSWYKFLLCWILFFLCIPFISAFVSPNLGVMWLGVIEWLPFLAVFFFLIFLVGTVITLFCKNRKLWKTFGKITLTMLLSSPLMLVASILVIKGIFYHYKYCDNTYEEEKLWLNKVEYIDNDSGYDPDKYPLPSCLKKQRFVIVQKRNDIKYLLVVIGNTSLSRVRLIITETEQDTTDIYKAYDSTKICYPISSRVFLVFGKTYW
jgi:hypothetical protein